MPSATSFGLSWKLKTLVRSMKRQGQRLPMHAFSASRQRRPEAGPRTQEAPAAGVSPVGLSQALRGETENRPMRLGSEDLTTVPLPHKNVTLGMGQ